MLIIWDYFGVIAQDSFWYTATRLARGMGASDEMQKLHTDVDLGKISWDEYCQAVAKDISVPYQEVVDRYQQHNIKQQNIMAIKHMPEHRHVLLSNASHTYLLPIMKRLGLDILFERIFVSSELGFAKPDERAFQAVLTAMDFEAHDALMVDDSSRNLDSASDLGLKTLLFHDGVDSYKEIQKLIT